MTSSNKDYILGVDIGTSSSKALAFKLDGKVEVQHQIPYKTQHPKPGYSEQNPDNILEAVVGVIRAVLKAMNRQPLCVSFSSAMHSLMAVNKKGDPISPLLIWSDNRSIKEAAEFKKKKLAIDIYQRTGTPIHAMSPLCKLLWWGKNEKASFKEAAKFISIKEYIFSRFFETYLAEYSLASATGLFDHERLKWYPPALDLIGIQTDKLPEPVSPTHICKGLKPAYSHQTGLDKDLSFVMGAGDGCLANLGTGVTQAGETAATIGTSGAVRLFSHHPVADKKGRIFNYLLVEKEYISGGAINNGGVLLDWYRHRFLKEDIPYDDVLKEAFSAEAGCRGLLFLPYLQGERSPMWDARARGAFIGISNTHEKPHFARAIIEGICYSLYHSARIIEEITDGIKEVYVSGGFTRSEKWIQMLTDIFEKEVKVSGHGDASSAGAAILGMKALGIIKDWKEAEKHIPITTTYSPKKDQTKIYHRNFELFAKMYDILCPAMHEIAEWQTIQPSSLNS